MMELDEMFTTVFGIDSGRSSGRWNMEFDRRLMKAFLDGRFQARYGEGSCVWRFYAWHPSAVTLGYNQDPGSIDSERCSAEGIDIVRRPTGGRAVLHAEEFTYSFIAETAEQNAVIYRMVHEVILHALETLGVHAEFCRSSLDLSRGTAIPVTCFTASARYELQAEGRKLVGSAQRRTGNVLLQHGSLPFTQAHKKLSRLVAVHDNREAATILAEMERKTVSLEELLGYIPAYSTLVGLIRDAWFRYSGTTMSMLERRELELFLGFSRHPSTSNPQAEQ
ncbi:lipoate--protein ligase family protein [Chlorobium limicola]